MRTIVYAFCVYLIAVPAHAVTSIEPQESQDQQIMKEYADAMALKWFTRAADGLNDEAMYRLADSYSWGKFTEVNTEKSWNLYRRSARFGHPYGIKALGIAYTWGFPPLNVEPDLEKARLYLRMAAMNGDTQAKILLNGIDNPDLAAIEAEIRLPWIGPQRASRSFVEMETEMETVVNKIDSKSQTHEAEPMHENTAGYTIEGYIIGSLNFSDRDPEPASLPEKRTADTSPILPSPKLAPKAFRESLERSHMPLTFIDEGEFIPVRHMDTIIGTIYQDNDTQLWNFESKPRNQEWDVVLVEYPDLDSIKKDIMILFQDK